MVTRARQHAVPISEVMEQITSLPYSLRTANDLKPSQWSALRFFAQSDPDVRTVGHFAIYNATTHSSASQTITTLVKGGHLQRVPNELDRRSHRLELTAKGRRMLEHDPILMLSEAISELPADDQAQLARSLATLFREIAKKRDARRANGTLEDRTAS